MIGRRVSTKVDSSIGYVRIILATASLYYMPLHPRTCSGLYSVSCLLDALDGYAARTFNQSTKFGGVLDMVTDRCTTSCLLVFLASAFPRWSLVFQGLISLDLASHYMHMYATLTMGGSGQSHKNVDESRSWILKQYYSNRVGSFLSCRRSQRFQADGPFLTGCPVHFLRVERIVLHRALSPLLLFTDTVPGTAEARGGSDGCAPAQAIDDLHITVVCGRHGIRAVRVFLAYAGYIAPNLTTSGQTRWIALSRGSWPQSHSQSWLGNKSSTWCSWSKPANGLQKATLKSAGD